MNQDCPYKSDRVSPDLFHGRRRAELVDAVLDAAVRGRSIALCGGHRIGKTTLLEKVCLEAHARGLTRGEHGLRVLPVLVNFLLRPGGGDLLDWVWGRVVDALPDHDRERLAPSPGASLADRLRRLLAADTPTQLLLLLDGTDRVLRDPAQASLPGYLRALITDERGVRGQLSLALAGSRDLHSLRRDIGSPLANALDWHFLELFDEEDTRQLVVGPTGGQGDAVAAEVYRLSGGHPYVVQYLMERVWPDPTAEGLRAAAAGFLKRQQGFLPNVWKGLGRRDRLAYAELDEAGVAPTLAVLDELVGAEWSDFVADRLCHNGVVRRGADGVELVGDLFRQWFRSYGRRQILPAVEQDVRNLLLDRVEPRLRSLCQVRLTLTPFVNCEGWMRAKHAGRRDPTKIYMGDYFQIIQSEMALFQNDFRFLAEGPGSLPGKLQLVAERLCSTRNALCHPSAAKVDKPKLRAARHTALQLLEGLPAAT